MKYLMHVLITSIVSCLFFTGSIYAQKEGNEKQSAVKAAIDSQQFVFTAEMAIPSSGQTRHLTSLYQVRVTKDSVIADLPYFGRAYNAPIDPSKGGINFTSTEFEYSKDNWKKGGWQIKIKPKDMSEVQQMFFTISDNGSATLHITNTNRQAISYRGHIDPA
jgi:hypothetical protein